ncbi:MAG: IclR family transcriptional regulator [Dictyoglomaceae bacterium]
MSSLEKSLDILELFNHDKKELSFSEIVKKTGFPKSTTHRILNILVNRKYLSLDANSKQYSIGIKLFELGSLFISSNIISIAIPVIEKLVIETGYTVLLASLIDGSLVYLFSQHGNSPLLVQSHTGQRRKPNYGILGKLLLAYLPEEEVDSILKRYPLEKTADNSITDPLLYKEELKNIRTKGYAYAKDETINGVSGFAAPIYNHEGKVIAGIALLFPTSLVLDNELEKLKSKLLRAAKSISEALGYYNYPIKGGQQQ